MNSLFNAENPFWEAMERLFDLFILNLLWLLCCLPVLTIGPATAALHYAVINLAEKEEHSVTKDFRKSFWLNFRQGIRLGVPLTATGIFLLADIVMSYRSGTGIYTFFLFFFSFLFIIYCFVVMYVFPLLAKLDRTCRELLILAFTLSIRHLGKTLLILAVLAFGIWSCHLFPGLIFLSFGLVAELHALLLLPVLKSFYVQ